MFDVLRFVAGGMVFFGICGLALWRGGWPEKAVALALVIDIIVSPFLQLNTTRQPEFAMLPLDLALMGVIIWVALKSDRWWPLFCAAFAALAALTHLAQALELQIGRNVYITAIILWDYLLVLSIGIGVWEVERRRRRAARSAA